MLPSMLMISLWASLDSDTVAAKGFNHQQQKQKRKRKTITVWKSHIWTGGFVGTSRTSNPSRKTSSLCWTRTCRAPWRVNAVSALTCRSWPLFAAHTAVWLSCWTFVPVPGGTWRNMWERRLCPEAKARSVWSRGGRRRNTGFLHPRPTAPLDN